MAASYNDNTVQYGSQELTIATVAYVADNISVSRPVKIIKRTDELDEPSGSVGIADFVEGSATLQLATGSTVIPIGGDTFSATFDSDIGSETFYVTSVDQPFSKDGETKVNIQFIKQYGA